MGANPIDYPHSWMPTEFTCNCGTKCRVDVEFSRWTEVGNFYRHCDKDEGHSSPSLQGSQRWGRQDERLLWSIVTGVARFDKGHTRSPFHRSDPGVDAG